MSVTFSLEGERIGLFSMDPGQTTGLAYTDLTMKGSTKEIFDRDPLVLKHVSCWDDEAEKDREEIHGSALIAKQFLNQAAQWNLRGIGWNRIYFVYESFTLLGTPGTTARSGISPVRVTNTVMGLLYKYPVIWVPQTPAMAKQSIPNNRLRTLGLWREGMGTKKLVHASDATRHAALFVRRNL